MGKREKGYYFGIKASFKSLIILKGNYAVHFLNEVILWCHCLFNILVC